MFNPSMNLYPVKQMSIFELLKSKINLSAILSNTQKTLNIVNQAIPIVNQVKPLVNNAKTIFKVINAVNSKDITSPVSNTKNIVNSQTNLNTNSPNFFI